MKFSSFALFSGVAALAHGAVVIERSSPISSAVVVKNIKKITAVSSNTDSIVKKINNQIESIEYGPQVGRNLEQIASIATSDVSAMGSSPSAGPYPVSAQKAICGAFIDFVHVHQALLNTVIGKHGLLAATGFGVPIAAGLRAIEGVVDTLAVDIIGLVPTCAAQATAAKKQLDGTLKQAVTVYGP